MEAVTRDLVKKKSTSGRRLPFESSPEKWRTDIFIYFYHYPVRLFNKMDQNLNSTAPCVLLYRVTVRSLSRFSLSLKLIYNNMRLYTLCRPEAY